MTATDDFGAGKIEIVKPSDIESNLVELAHQFFAAVSFQAGGRPAYEDIRELFVGAGLLIKNTGPEPEVSTTDAFIRPRQELVDSGRLTAFEETEIEHRIVIFGQIADYLCTYTKTAVTDGVTTNGRGVVSIQFVKHGDSWKMASMVWDDERDGLLIPSLA